MTVRLLVVAVLVAAFAVAPLLHRRRMRRLQEQPVDGASLPGHLLEGAHRTWVLFTTPWCATCGPVEERLRAHDPGARFVTVDATRDRDLAGALGVRSAPTVLLADGHGRVQTRLVGPEAVDRYVVTASTA
ncbi:MAG TPA: thioredoxin family protein [Acidimicrobiales bacterium]